MVLMILMTGGEVLQERNDCHQSTVLLLPCCNALYHTVIVFRIMFTYQINGLNGFPLE